MNFFSAATLMFVFVMALMITMVAFAMKIYSDSENMSILFEASIFVLLTIMFLGLLVTILPKTEKLISSEKCADYETTYRKISLYNQENQDEKTFQIKMTEDENCETPYIEIRKTVIDLQVLQNFEVRKVDEYILHMPSKTTLSEEALE